MDKIELLAPAGEWDAFIAAVENGADAVYLGGTLFNARQSAGNFDSQQLKNAIDYAHVRDVKVYLTMNTLISDLELKSALELAAEAYFMGIDGIIVQDLGLADLVKTHLPGLELHGSTQMTIYSLQGVRVLENLGFRRVVLARELSLSEIQYISQNTPLEVEAFVHGALCVCYSGQCLMSSIIGGRSGNRGKCAQPCRLPYSLIKNNSSVEAKGRYILSPKDICFVEELENIAAAGVKSLKIEGRMKNPEYVATVVRIYRKYIDIMENKNSKTDEKGFKVKEEDYRALTQIFNRGGFSKGYLRGKTGYGLMSYQKPKNWGVYMGEVISYDKNAKTVKLRLQEGLSNGDGIEIWNGEDESPGTVVSDIRVQGDKRKAAGKGEVADVGILRGKIYKGNKAYKTSDKKLILTARESFSGRTVRKTPLKGKIIIKKNMPAVLYATDNRGNSAEVKGEIPAQTAVNVPLTGERVMDQLNKTGKSPFDFLELEAELDEGITVPISEINAVRRRALEEIESLRRYTARNSMSKDILDKCDNGLYFPGNSRKKTHDLKLTILFYNVLEELDYTTLNVDRIYLPFKSLTGKKGSKLSDACKEGGKELYAWIPPVTRGNWDRLIETNIGELAARGLDGILIGNSASLEITRKYPAIKTAGDYSLNAFNSITIDRLHRMGYDSLMLSYESTLEQIESFRCPNGLEKEVLVYGRIPLMVSEHCPIGSVAGNWGLDSECGKECLKGDYKIKDRMGMEFPVLCDTIDCRSTIFNCNVLFVPQALSKIREAGIDSARINIIDESQDQIREIVEIYRSAASDSREYLRKYKQIIERIRKRGHTKGHYFRGV